MTVLSVDGDGGDNNVKSDVTTNNYLSINVALGAFVVQSSLVIYPGIFIISYLDNLEDLLKRSMYISAV